MDLKSVIIAAIERVAEEMGSELNGQLSDDSVLLESGLDSLGFAVLVTELETELGYDPFVLMDVPVYPRTLADLVGVYNTHAPEKAS